MHGLAMLGLALGISAAMLAGPRKPEPPPLSGPLRALAKACEKRRGVSVKAFERHLVRKQSAAWTVAVVGEDDATRRAMITKIAKTIGVAVTTVEPGDVVGKSIGETEKNLDGLLQTAEEQGAVLLFDEADALFGKRTKVEDAHDKYADEAASTIPARVREAQVMVFVGLRSAVARSEGQRDAVVVVPEPDQEAKSAKPPWRTLCWPPRAD